MERKRINDALPVSERKNIEASIDELQLPIFRTDAIGALHEAAEAFAVSKCY